MTRCVACLFQLTYCQDRYGSASEHGETSRLSMQAQFISMQQQGLEQYFAGKQNKFVKLDMVEAMKEAKLDELFHVDLWPASTAVRELATQRKTKSFVFSDLKKSVSMLLSCVA